MEDEARVVIKCAGEMSIARAEEIREDLWAALRADRPIAVDCSAVTGIDVSFVQLLMAARISAKRRGISFRLSKPISETLVTALLRGGFVAAVPLPNEDFWNGGE
jgi:anti-anti-sigma regulatory factor